MFCLTHFVYSQFILDTLFSYNIRSNFNFTWVCMCRSDEQMCTVEITTYDTFHNFICHVSLKTARKSLDQMKVFLPNQRYSINTVKILYCVMVPNQYSSGMIVKILCSYASSNASYKVHLYSNKNPVSYCVSKAHNTK